MNDLDMKNLMNEWKNMGLLYKTCETTVEDILIKLRENSNDLDWERD